MKKDLYWKTKTSLNQYKNLGFNYKNNIFLRTSSFLFFTNERRKRIILKLEELIYYLIEEVKEIKKFFNFTIHKKSKDLI